MVEIDPLDERDRATLRNLIERHLDYTGSEVARRILADWQRCVGRFVKVMPVEYRKVLARQNLDSDAAKLASV